MHIKNKMLDTYQVSAYIYIYIYAVNIFTGVHKK